MRTIVSQPIVLRGLRPLLLILPLIGLVGLSGPVTAQNPSLEVGSGEGTGADGSGAADACADPASNCECWTLTTQFPGQRLCAYVDSVTEEGGYFIVGTGRITLGSEVILNFTRREGDSATGQSYTYFYGHSPSGTEASVGIEFCDECQVVGYTEVTSEGTDPDLDHADLEPSSSLYQAHPGDWEDED
jgi:hypothetical protein